MTIAYDYGNALYLNITNKCPCDCVFCIRNNSNGIGGHSLWLEREPTQAEINEALVGLDYNRYEEVVFCGYGEPTSRLDALVSTARLLKEGLALKLPLRLNTNGLGGLTNKTSIVPLIAEYIDAVSISLNAPDAETYVKSLFKISSKSTAQTQQLPTDQEFLYTSRSFSKISCTCLTKRRNALQSIFWG